MKRENSNQLSEFYVKAKALAEGLLHVPGTRAAARWAAIAVLTGFTLLVAGCGTTSFDEEDDYDESVVGSDVSDTDEGHFD